jgi:hypothetical protein
MLLRLRCVSSGLLLPFRTRGALLPTFLLGTARFWFLVCSVRRAAAVLTSLPVRAPPPLLLCLGGLVACLERAVLRGDHRCLSGSPLLAGEPFESLAELRKE